jgi:hypothetical protein
MDYESVTTIDSARAGVRLHVRRMSFGRRLELMRRVRDLARKVEFLEAGSKTGEQMDAGLLRAEIDRMFVLWGLAGIAGLEVDGAEATPEALVERGPEDVFREALAAVRREAGLTEEERKNCSSPSTFDGPARPAGSATRAGNPAWT